MKFGTNAAAVEINAPSKAALFPALRERLISRQGFAIATLNLDHLTKLPRDPAFAAAYQAHDFVVADGRPIVWLSKLAGTPVELMPGSDMIIPICELCVELDVPIALVGSSDEALNGASSALSKRVAGLRITYVHAPPFGFDPTGSAAGRICEDVEESGAGICFIALGAPKQELFAAHARPLAPSVGFVSIGAGLDFLSGHQVRAPKVMRLIAMEWLWRAMQSPVRMVPRYAKCFAILPRLTLQALRQRRATPPN